MHSVNTSTAIISRAKQALAMLMLERLPPTESYLPSHAPACAYSSKKMIALNSMTLFCCCRPTLRVLNDLRSWYITPTAGYIAFSSLRHPSRHERGQLPIFHSSYQPASHGGLSGCNSKVSSNSRHEVFSPGPCLQTPRIQTQHTACRPEICELVPLVLFVHASQHAHLLSMQSCRVG